jgi:hypothetical protein
MFPQVGQKSATLHAARFCESHRVVVQRSALAELAERLPGPARLAFGLVAVEA